MSKSEPSSTPPQTQGKTKSDRLNQGMIGFAFGAISLGIVLLLALGKALEPVENYFQMLIFQMGYESLPTAPELFVVKKDSKTSSKINEDIGRMDYASVIRFLGNGRQAPFPGGGSYRQDLVKLELGCSMENSKPIEFSKMKLSFSSDSISLGTVQTGLGPQPFVSFSDQILSLPTFLRFPPTVNPDFEFSGLPVTSNKSSSSEWWRFFVENLVSLDFKHRFKIKTQDGVINYALSAEKSLPPDFYIPPAAVIGVDFILQGRRGEDDEEKLKILPSALASCEVPVVLAAHTETNKQKIDPLQVITKGLSQQVPEGPESILVTPDPMFLCKPEINLGMINVLKQRGNMVRELPIFLPHPDGKSLFPAFSLAMAALYLDKTNGNRFPGPVWLGLQQELSRILRDQKAGVYSGGIWINGKLIPTDRDGRMLIRFVGSTKKNRFGKRVIPSVSFYEAYDDNYLKQLSIRTGKSEEFNPETVHLNTCSLYSNYGNRICMLGPFEMSDFDMYDTPLSYPTPYRVDDELLMGIEVHANATLNILHGNPFRHASPLIGWILLIPMTLLLGVFLDKLSPVVSTVVTLFAIALSLGFAYFYLHVWGRVMIISPFVFSFFLTWTNATITNYYRKWAQANSTKQMFQRFVSADVVQFMLEHPEFVKPGGQSVELTIFFSDVAG
ncbi:CHASE2 domain-containing protein, partial [bacterium]|nr:CHASE2 domain-containing protein [bacterium]